MQYEKSATLSTHQDQTLFQPMDVDCRNGAVNDTASTIQTKIGSSLNAGGVVAYTATKEDSCLTPWDVQSRRVMDENGQWPALYAGEGGGHGYVMQNVSEPTICIQGNCIDRADTAGCNGKGWTEDVSYTLNTIDRPAVVQGVPLINDQGGSSINGDDSATTAPTLRAEMHGNVPAVAQSAGFKYLQGAKAKGIAYESEKAPTLSANQADASVIVALENHPNDSRVKISDDNIIQTLSSRMGTGGEVYSMTTGEYMTVSKEQTSTLLARDFKDPQCVTYQQVTGSLMANSHPGSYTGQDANNDMLVAGIADQQYIVRRLTPLECERLQGFPDGWTDIGAWDDSKGKHHKESTDSARYKALGNSIALPPWRYVLQKLSLCCYSDRTMGSLFDGIGGFPLIWESLNGEGSCLWASEIENFPISVTKRHFSEDG